MENVLVTNNGQANWAKLSIFGLHSRASHIGFNRYAGKHGAIYLIDKVSGMKVMFQPAQSIRSERETKSFKIPGKRGRPAIVGCVQQVEGKKRGRPAHLGPIMFREPGIRGRKAFIGPKEELIFAGPLRKRGPKTGSVQVQGKGKAFGSTETLIVPVKKGRMSEKERIANAEVGSIIKANGGGYWRIIAKGLPSYQPTL